MISPSSALVTSHRRRAEHCSNLGAVRLCNSCRRFGAWGGCMGIFLAWFGLFLVPYACVDFRDDDLWRHARVGWIAHSQLAPWKEHWQPPLALGARMRAECRPGFGVDRSVKMMGCRFIFHFYKLPSHGYTIHCVRVSFTLFYGKWAVKHLVQWLGFLIVEVPVLHVKKAPNNIQIHCVGNI